MAGIVDGLTIPHRYGDGSFGWLEADVLGVADRLAEYDPRMYLLRGEDRSPAAGKYVVMRHMEDGRHEQLMVWDTAKGGPLTVALIDRIWQHDTWRPGNDVVGRLEAEADAIEAAEEAELHDRVAEDIAPRMARALKTDGADVPFSPIWSPGFDVPKEASDGD